MLIIVIIIRKRIRIRINNTEKFAVTPRNEYLSMSLGGSEKNRWFQLFF